MSRRKENLTDIERQRKAFSFSSELQFDPPDRHREEPASQSVEMTPTIPAESQHGRPKWENDQPNQANNQKQEKEKTKKKDIDVVFVKRIVILCAKTNGFKDPDATNIAEDQSNFSAKNYNQFSCAYMKMSNGTYKSFDIIKPSKKHAEEVLIEQIDTYLKNRQCDVELIIFYTLYSPCKKCKKKLRSAFERWKKFGIHLVVCFSFYWKKSYLPKLHFIDECEDDLKDLFFTQDCKLTNLEKKFAEYLDQVQAMPFKIEISKGSLFNEKYFKELIEEINKGEKKLRQKRNEEFRSAKSNLLKELNDLAPKKKHIEAITEFCNNVILNFNLKPNPKISTNISKAMITKPFNKMCKEKIAADFERAAIQEMLQENNHPLKLIRTKIPIEFTSKTNLNNFSLEHSPTFKKFIGYIEDRVFAN